MPLQLLSGVIEELKRMETEGHIENLKAGKLIHKPDRNHQKENGSIRLALNSKLLNDLIFENKYQMPNIYGLMKTVALQLSEKTDRQAWFLTLI